MIILLDLVRHFTQHASVVLSFHQLYQMAPVAGSFNHSLEILKSPLALGPTQNLQTFESLNCFEYYIPSNVLGVSSIISKKSQKTVFFLCGMGYNMLKCIKKISCSASYD